MRNYSARRLPMARTRVLSSGGGFHRLFLIVPEASGDNDKGYHFRESGGLGDGAHTDETALFRSEVDTRDSVMSQRLVLLDLSVFGYLVF
jgi:hypothetical protein